MTCVTTIDWAATGSMLQGIGTIAGVGAVVWGAINGAEAWKKQKQAERRLEMAERILTATHKARRALGYVRGPMMWGHELSIAEEKIKDGKNWSYATDEKRQRLTTAQAYYNRLDQCKDEQLALDDCLPMARALFSDKLENALSRLRLQFWSVKVFVDAYVDDGRGTDENFTRQIRQAMYEMPPMNDEKNEITDAITEAVAVIERICEPALRLEDLRPVPAAEAVT